MVLADNHPKICKSKFMWTVTYELIGDIIFVTAFLAVILMGLLGNTRFESLKKAFEKSQKWIQNELDRWKDSESLDYGKETQENLEIWENLIQVRNSGLGLVTASMAIATDEYHKIQKEIYFDRFINSWKEFRDVMQKNQPLFDPEIYAKLDLLIGDELISNRDRVVEITPEFIEEAENVTRKIIMGIDEICESLKKEMSHSVFDPRINLN